MKTSYKYIEFKVIDRKLRTEKYLCMNTRVGAELGIIQWHGPWRQYCFFPTVQAVYSTGCLNDIADFIKQLMEEKYEQNRSIDKKTGRSQG